MGKGRLPVESGIPFLPGGRLNKTNYKLLPHEGSYRPIQRRPSPAFPVGGSKLNNWSGVWRPKKRLETMTMGMLNDDISPLDLQPRDTMTSIVPLTAPTISYPVPTQQETPSIWSTLMNGLSSVVNARVGGYVAQTQQRTLAQTYNPALTGAAINARQWQQAYGSGISSAPMSTGTMAMIGAAGLLGLYLITRK